MGALGAAGAGPSSGLGVGVPGRGVGLTTGGGPGAGLGIGGIPGAGVTTGGGPGGFGPGSVGGMNALPQRGLITWFLIDKVEEIIWFTLFYNKLSS